MIICVLLSERERRLQWSSSGLSLSDKSLPTTQPASTECSAVVTNTSYSLDVRIVLLRSKVHHTIKLLKVDATASSLDGGPQPSLI